MSTELDLKSFIQNDKDVKAAACPTYYRRLTPKFIAMTRLEDEAPHLKSGFGKLDRETQEQVIAQPDFPADEAENVRAHWKLWDENFYEELLDDGTIKGHGVKLVEGGKEGVDEFADEWLAAHPKSAGKTRKPKAKRGPKSKDKDEKRKGGDNKIKKFMIAPWLKDEFFPDWQPEELATIEEARQGRPEAMARVISERISAAGLQAKEEYAIVHNRDVWVVDDFINSGGDPEKAPGMPKAAHMHYICNAGEDRKDGLTIKDIADAIGYLPRTENATADDDAIRQAQIEKAKDRFTWGNWLSYLIHAKDADKTPYSPDEVLTLKGASYSIIAEARSRDWQVGAIKKRKKKLRDLIPWLVHECACGHILPDDILESLPDGRPSELYAIYAQSAASQREVKAALAAGKELRLATSRNALRNREFERTNLYIYGEAGTGKTMLAKTLESGLEHVFPLIDEPHHWRSQRLASRNPLDDYDGREVVTINEFRSSTFGEMQAFLQFTDPHDCDPFGNRYHNTAAGAQRVTVLTTPTPPQNLFFFMPKAGSGNARCDSIDQALRRFAFVIEVLDPREHHDYKYRLYRPTKRPTPYAVEIEIDEFDSEYMDLTIYLEPFDALLGADGLLEILVRDLDTRANGGRLAASGLMDEAIRYFQNEFRHVIEGAVANEGFPSLPPIEVTAKEVKNDDEETSEADA